YDGSSDHPASICSRLLGCNRHRRRCFMSRLEKLLRHFRVAELLRIQVHYRDPGTVLHLRLPQVMEMLLPMPKVLQVFGHMLGKQDVTGITTIHRSLGEVEAGASDDGATTHTYYSAHRATVHSHTELE